MSESNVSSRIKRLLNTYSGLVLMGAVGIPIGIIVGAICALFGRVLLAIGAFRDEHITLLLPFLALMGFAIVFSYRTWGKGTDWGMSLVFDVGHGREDAISPRLVPLIMLSTWGTHLFGGSAGREGVAVQIGATVSHWIGRRLPFRKPRQHVFAHWYGRWLCRALSNASCCHGLCYRSTGRRTHGIPRAVSRAYGLARRKYDLRRPGTREVRSRRCRLIRA